MAQAARLRLRLFLEGVEVPVISAVVQGSPNSPLMASIQIPPLPEATRFLPRTLVHLFFYDFDDLESTVSNTSLKTILDASPEYTETQQADQELRRYKLLFTGEIMGFSWTKGAVSRSVVLQCSDPSNYWDSAQQFNNTDLFGPGYKAAFSGGSTNLFTNFLDSPSSVIISLLKQPPVRYPEMKGLLGGIIHVLEAIGGTKFKGKRVAGQNVFFTLAEIRLHITQMLSAYDKDPTANRLLGPSYDALFGRTIGNLGDQVSYRTVLNALMGAIFHETYAQPCPYYTPGTNLTVSGYDHSPISRVTFLAPYAAHAQELVDTIFTWIPQFEEDTGDNKALSLAIASAKKDCTTWANAAKTKIPKDSVKGVKDAADGVSKNFKLAANALGEASKCVSPTKGKSKTAKTTGVTQLHLAAEMLTRIQTTEVTITAAKEAIPAQLRQQIFRPDVWFSAPPRCNVVFPDMYTQLDFQRQYMAEPTRLLLKTNDEFFGEDILFDQFYFAPKSVTMKGEKTNLKGMLKNDVLYHELYTGIIPVFEKMGEFNIFAAKAGVTKGKLPKIGMAQRTTNFLYFKYRFAARHMQVSMKFNPYIAFGFPGLIIDKYVDISTLRAHNQLRETLSRQPQEVNKMLGTHFLGNFTEITHQIDQRGGATMVNCGYARQVEESVEFLGQSQDDAAVLRKTSEKKNVTTPVAAVTAPKVGNVGPNLGKITAVKDVTRQYNSDVHVDMAAPDRERMKIIMSATQLPLYLGNLSSTKNNLARVSPNIVAYAKDFDLDNLSEGLMNTYGWLPDQVIVFRAYEVTETQPVYKAGTVDLTAEELIRPGWYGSCWSSDSISDVYQQFFGISAITDISEVGNQQESATTVIGDAATALAQLADGTLDPIQAQSALAVSLSKGSSIEQAAAFLVLTYSLIKQGNFDPGDFIRNYTWRPIASMLDMFGTSDLQLSTDGADVLSGIEGFHSRAFGPYDDLFGLVTPEVEELLGMSRGSLAAKRQDTRQRKQAAVLEYTAVLNLSKALLG